MSEKLEVATSLRLRFTVCTRNWPDGREAGSSEFRFQGVGWRLGFRKSPGRCIVYLHSCSGMLYPGRTLRVSVHVEISDDGGRIARVLQWQRRLLRESLCPYIWLKRDEEIVSSVPEFRLHGVLNLVVFLKGVESSRGEKCAQTSLTIDPVPCFDSLSEDLARLLDSGSNTDVDFRCGGQSTKAHRLVVSARSPVLASMLQSRWAEGATGIVKIEDMDLGALRLFVRYLYTGRLEGAPAFETAAALYEAADKYQVRGLAARCAQSLIEGLTVDNACDVLAMADRHCDGRLMGEVCAFVRGRRLPSTDSKHWTEFRRSHPSLAEKVLDGYAAGTDAPQSKRSKHCMELRDSRPK